MKPVAPAQSILLLLLAGVAIGGILYGLHWKRVASGDLFTADERATIRLQDQIGTLTATNAELSEKIKSLTKESEVEPDPKPISEPVPVRPIEVETAPVLPVRAQKIETH